MSQNKSGSHVAGARWRLLAHRDGGPLRIQNDGVFDELTIDDWLHIEQMDTTAWWMRVGDASIWIDVSEEGHPIVNIERGAYTEVRGDSTIYEPPGEADDG